MYREGVNGGVCTFPEVTLDKVRLERNALGGILEGLVEVSHAQETRRAVAALCQRVANNIPDPRLTVRHTKH